DEKIPVFGTMASQFNDPGMNQLFTALMKKLQEKTGVNFQARMHLSSINTEKNYIIPPNRNRYLAEIAEANDLYLKWVENQSAIAQKMYQLKGALDQGTAFSESVQSELRKIYTELEAELDHSCRKLIGEWPNKVREYLEDEFIYQVRDKEIRQSLFSTSLSGLRIPKIALPKYEAW